MLSSKENPILLAIAFSFILILGTQLDLSLSESISVCLFIYLTLNLVINFGKSVWIFVDTVSLILVLTCLIAPLFFYHYFTESNYLARLWVKYMPVPSETYYNYALPASLSLIFGFNIPLIKRQEPKFTINDYALSGYLLRPKKIGLQLILISIFIQFINPLIPGALNFVAYLFNKLIFIGFLYLYFSSRRPDVKWIFLAGGLLILQSLQLAMFGELIFMSLLASIIFTYGKNYSTFSKASIIFLGVFTIALIQSIKLEYRTSVWSGQSSGNTANVALFTSLATQKAQDVKGFLSEDKLFFTAVRFNQGWLVASVMENVPRSVPYANGETIWKSFLASLAPRFLWPDKPKAGGKENIERFLGWDLKGTSMNIGLLGESYANFGVTGGVIFLFFYGLAFQWVYNFAIRLSHHYPTLLIWFPLLFYYAIGVENDILTVINHLTKTGFFIYVLYKIYPKIFGLKL